MNKKRATQYLNEFYDSTYADTITYISGKTGDTDIASDVITDTFTDIYGYILSLKTVDEKDLGEYFYGALNFYIEKYQKELKAETEFQQSSSEERLLELITKDLDISEKQAIDDMLIKKSHSFVMQRSAIERKAFILFFYEGYSLEKTAELLGISTDILCGYLERTLLGIQSNFLSKYISK